MFKIIFRTLAAVAMVPSTFFTFDLFCLLTERTLELNHFCPFSILLLVPVEHSLLFTKALDTWTLDEDGWQMMEKGRSFVADQITLFLFPASFSPARLGSCLIGVVSSLFPLLLVLSVDNHLSDNLLSHLHLGCRNHGYEQQHGEQKLNKSPSIIRKEWLPGLASVIHAQPGDSQKEHRGPEHILHVIIWCDL